MSFTADRGQLIFGLTVAFIGCFLLLQALWRLRNLPLWFHNTGYVLVGVSAIGFGSTFSRSGAFPATGRGGLYWLVPMAVGGVLGLGGRWVHLRLGLGLVGRMASVTESASVVIGAELERVWQFVRDPESARLLDGVTAAFVVPGSPAGEVGERQAFITRTADGVATVRMVEVVELTAPTRVVVRTLRDSLGSALDATELREVSSGTELSVRQEQQLPRTVRRRAGRADPAEVLRTRLDAIRSVLGAPIAESGTTE